MADKPRGQASASTSSNPASETNPGAITPRENPLPGTEDSLPKDYQRASHDLLYESIMQSGGEPFGNSLGPGVTTLTNRSVKRFKKRGYFYISTYENFAERKNRFTRAGSAARQTDFPPEVLEWIADPSKRPKLTWWQRAWRWIWP